MEKIRPLTDFHLTQQDKEVAKLELNENPSEVGRHLDKLKQMLLAEPNLVPRTDDSFLLSFLRTRKFDVDRAFKMVLNYYKGRSRNPDLFYDFRVSDNKKIFDANVLTMLPQRDPLGRAVFLLRVGLCDPKNISGVEGMRTLAMAIEWQLQYFPSQINGIVGILDFANFGWEHIKEYVKMSLMIRALVFLQDAFPSRNKTAHVLNAPFLVRTALQTIMPFLSEKLRKRVVFHGSDLSTLYQYVPASILPEEYGGDQGPVDCMFLYNHLLEWEPEYLHNLKFGFENGDC